MGQENDIVNIIRCVITAIIGIIVVASSPVWIIPVLIYSFVKKEKRG